MSIFESRRVSQIANHENESGKGHRVHERHTLSDRRLSNLTFESGLVATIKNLSYSGISVEFAEEDMKTVSELFDKDTTETWVADLTIGFEKTKSKFTLVRRIGRHVAFAFVHDLAETLVFLREILEPMRVGSTMVPSYGFDGDQWKDRRFTLKGDGLSEVNFMIDEFGKLLFSRLTYTNQGYIYEVTFQDNKIETGVAVINFGSAANTKNNQQNDVRLLRQSLFILFGINNEAISEQKIDLASEITNALAEISGNSDQHPAA